MDVNDRRKRETEALIEAIWGPQAAVAPASPDPQARAAQNRALAEAMRGYLQQYLAEDQIAEGISPPSAPRRETT